MRPTVSRLTLAVTLLFSISSQTTFAQQRINVVTTAVPFLRISPDARAGAMGDLALATMPDASSSYYNIGKVPFNESKAGVNLTYTPWLKKIVPDVYLASVAGYYKLDDLQAVSASLRYFNLGEIQFTNEQGQDIGSERPNEFGVDVGYSRKLSDKIGVGVGLKFIHSNLANKSVNGNSYKPGNAVAGDLGFYFNNLNELGSGVAVGAAFTNLGSKIAYTDNADQKDFIPANFGIGATYTKAIDESNKVSFGIDVNKLLVPTPPQFLANPTNDPDIDQQNVDLATEYRNKSVVSSWFSSFGDAPGGFSEELKEFQFSVGGEYWYNNQFALRAGYFHEDQTKGNRRFFTTGVGLKYNIFGLNFSYLIPSGSGNNQNPLSNTLRFSLVFDLSGEGTDGGF